LSGSGLNDACFRRGFYGERVAALENAIDVALSRMSGDPLLIRAKALQPIELYLLVTLAQTGKALFHVDQINFTSMIAQRQTLVERLADSGWLDLGIHDVPTQLGLLRLDELRKLSSRLGYCARSIRFEPRVHAWLGPRWHSPDRMASRQPP